MTQEEKAKAYDIALARAREIHRNEDDKVKDMEFLFPELKEDEDERMRNVAINACKYMVDNFENSTKQYEDAITWLEKQKPVIAESEKWLIDETLYLLDEFQQSNRCCSENELQNSVSCMDWLKSLKQRMGG